MRQNVIYDKWGRPLRRWGEYDVPRAQFAQPGLADLRPVDPVVVGLSIAMRPENYIWDQVAPVMEVTEQSGTIPIYTAGFWFRRQEGAERAPEGPYLQVGYGTSTTTYETHEYGFEKPLGDVIRAGSQFPDDQEEVAAQFITNLINLEMEKLAAETFFVTGAWANEATLATTDQWSDYDASEPVLKADDAKRAIRRAVGVNPNVLVLGAETFDDLVKHPLILDRFKYTTPGVITAEMLAPLFGVETVVVGDAPEETTAEGGAGTRADIWGDSALFCVVNKPGLMVRAGAFTVMWNEKGNIPWLIETYRREEKRSLVTRGFTHADPKIVSTAHGYLFLDTAA